MVYDLYSCMYINISNRITDIIVHSAYNTDQGVCGNMINMIITGRCQEEAQVLVKSLQSSCIDQT